MLVSFHAGVNDAMRPNYKPELVLPLYQAAVRTIAASGATVLLFTALEKIGNTATNALVKKQTSGALWLIIFLLPWIWRRLRGKSSGDGRVCKYPTPVKWSR